MAIDLKDIRYVQYICDTCHGEGDVRSRAKFTGGMAVQKPCPRCKGSGVYATGQQLIGLLEHIQHLQSAREKELVHRTTINEEITVRLVEVGVELHSRTGNFIFISGGDNHLVVGVKPKGVDSGKWEVKDDTKRD